ncbi:hypothetical protein EMMF5_006451 [Cystobasidiomycetes sp. EMM_F5]
MTDDEINKGLKLCAQYGVATACVKPYSVSQAVRALEGSGVLVCPVVGFPAGNSSTAVKAYEAALAADQGGKEIDVVVNVGKVLSYDWEYVEAELKTVNDAVVSRGAILKVIFETDYLKDEHIVKLCEICTKVGVAFIKTSTGFGFVKQSDSGLYNYNGATIPHLALMRKSSGENVKIKASGGVRTLDELLVMMALGIDRVGTSSTVSIIEEAKKRGISEQPTKVTLRQSVSSATNPSVTGY